jgi:hypothetical protein
MKVLEKPTPLAAHDPRDKQQLLGQLINFAKIRE